MNYHKSTDMSSAMIQPREREEGKRGGRGREKRMGKNEELAPEPYNISYTALVKITSLHEMTTSATTTLTL